MNFNVIRNKIEKFLFEEDPENENGIIGKETKVKPQKVETSKPEPKIEIKEEPAEKPIQDTFISITPKETKPEILEPKKEEHEKITNEIYEPYELREIISPFYGVSKEEAKQPVKSVKKTSKTATTKKDSIISPFYGYDDKAANDMRFDSKVLYRKEKKQPAQRKTRSKKSLPSDMLNSSQDNSGSVQQ